MERRLYVICTSLVLLSTIIWMTPKRKGIRSPPYKVQTANSGHPRTSVSKSITTTVAANSVPKTTSILLATSDPTGNNKDNRKRVRHKLCLPMRYLNRSTTRPRTALHSYPGSGNTWMRHLLHQATGIYTGSVYNSYILQKEPEFKGERRSDNTVLCVKTHSAAGVNFDRALILVRDPRDAFLAEFNRQNADKTSLTSEAEFKSPSWETFLRKQIPIYRSRIQRWLHDFRGDIYIVNYDDLKTDLLQTLNGAVKFLTGKDIPQEIRDCIWRHSEGKFRRTGTLHIDPYLTVSKPLMINVTEARKLLYDEVNLCIDSGRCGGRRITKLMH